MSKLGELMVELRQVALQGDPARCAEPMSGVNVEQTKWAVARNTVHHTPELRSRLVLPVAPN